MSRHFTAKNWPIGEAPDRIALRGNPRNPEPCQHIIEFPGGAIELSRLDDGSYWAHIIVNQNPGHDAGSTREEAKGLVIQSRIDTPDGIIDVPYAETLTQIAVRISPRFPVRLGHPPRTREATT